ncbi:MAG: ribosome biogenesis GTP-binding protein YihA/YsxC [Pseudomonadota bacterium]|nr:ribosome biogenesis GTP-binding protein YihA/YsxC [Pseudomonadota bacterium]
MVEEDPSSSEKPSFEKSQIEHGRHLFAQECQFFHGTDTLKNLPEASLPEVAFVGRSNVGKSSLINALTGRKSLARTSNTPGRTQQLNFFNLGFKMIIVDLPGYGYARVSKTQVARWTKTMKLFLRGRAPLRRICLLIDARRGLKDLDREMMDLMDSSAVVYQLVLTKVDKTSQDELRHNITLTEKELKKRPAAFPILIQTSALGKIGLAELRASLAQLVL